MNSILKAFKFIGKFFATILLLLLFSGICYRIFSSKPVVPGKLVDVNGTKIHVRVDGEKKSMPTIIIEAGAHSNTDMLYWLAEGLKEDTKVIRYDRDGKWFSESSDNEQINAEFYAKQLHGLLNNIGEKPPYILVGHSMGGPYNRIFRDLYPNEVAGMILIDASHPEQWKRLSQKELIPKAQISIMKFGAVLADLGILGIYNKTFNKSTNQNDGLPEELHQRARSLTSNSGEIYRMFLRENELNRRLLDRASKVKKIGSLPVLVFTAKEQYREAQKTRFRKEGIDPDKEVEIWFGLQKELADLSTNKQHIFMNADHGTIITKKENADVITKEIIKLGKSLEMKSY